MTMKHIALGVGVVFVIGIGAYSIFFAKPQEPMTQNTTTTDGLIIQDIRTGSGAEAKTRAIVSVNYLGTLPDGTKFDSSYDRGQPFSFTIGKGEVIQGWEKGLIGMKVGGKRKLTIPASLAYGDRGVPGMIPANATLVFEIELLGVR
ncbi:MAG: FKBP-type peptidyl-prolyl cis-trans isomerase [Candidatus Liptonbacteria bacterium]|nr:FKBP-type peptidyl-prolyl cis-trans isomerase [Candidatus Liptonbacteria bacterium]